MKNTGNIIAIVLGALGVLGGISISLMLIRDGNINYHELGIGVSCISMGISISDSSYRNIKGRGNIGNIIIIVLQSILAAGGGVFGFLFMKEGDMGLHLWMCVGIIIIGVLEILANYRDIRKRKIH